MLSRFSAMSLMTFFLRNTPAGYSTVSESMATAPSYGSGGLGPFGSAGYQVLFGAGNLWVLCGGCERVLLQYSTAADDSHLNGSFWQQDLTSAILTRESSQPLLKSS